MTATGPAWSYTAGPFEALGHSFALHTTDLTLGHYLEQLWASCRSEGEPDTTYGLEVIPGSRDDADTYDLYVGDTVVREYNSPSIALRDLIRHVNADVIAAAGELVVVHASGAVRDGKGVLFPAAMESGKTTLVAGLVQAGWSYLSDELVGIDPGTLELHPYPKPLSIDRGSWDLLADLRPNLPLNLASYSAEQWQVPAEQIRAGSTEGVVPPVAVIGPIYKAGAATSLEPLRLVESVMLLAESCFTLRGRGEQSLHVLTALATRCACYRMIVGDLERACDLIDKVVEPLARQAPGDTPRGGGGPAPT